MKNFNFVKKDAKENNKMTTILKIDKLQVFGENAFFTGRANNFSAKSIGFSTIIKINREKF